MYHIDVIEMRVVICMHSAFKYYGYIQHPILKAHTMNKRILQFSIKSFDLIKRGVMDDREEDMNMLHVSLSYPAEGVDKVDSIKTFLATEKIPVKWTDFDKSILFKVPVRGQAKLSVTVTSVDEDSKAEKFFRDALSKGAKDALGGFGNAFTGKLLGKVGEKLSDLLAGDDKGDIDVIGENTIMINSNNIEDTITMDLKVKKAIKKKVHIKGVKGPRSRTSKTLIPKGSNGTITMDIKILAETP